MKLPALGLGAILLACLAVSPSHAQQPQQPPPASAYPPAAPAAGGGGWCYGPYYGTGYGQPNYSVLPSGLPFQGFVPPVGLSVPGAGNGNGNGGRLASPLFPTHPYARSPRDYFMLD